MYKPCMAFLYQIPAPRDHQHRYPYLFKFTRLYTRLRRHKPEHFLFANILFIEKRPEAYRRIAAKDMKIKRIFQAARKQITSVKYEFIDISGILKSENHRDIGAVAEAEKMNPVKSVKIKKMFQVFRKSRQ